MLNKAILMGRLTRDPELNNTPNGKSYSRFGLAVNRSHKDANGDYIADFLDCVAWGKLGEHVKQWYKKGMMAVIVGSIHSNNWKDKNGNSRTSIIIKVDEISFGETKKARGENNSMSSSSYKAPPYVTPDENEFAELGDDDGEVPF